jgi:hypothetical protein
MGLKVEVGIDLPYEMAQKERLLDIRAGAGGTGRLSRAQSATSVISGIIQTVKRITAHAFASLYC